MPDERYVMVKARKVNEKAGIENRTLFASSLGAMFGGGVLPGRECVSRRAHLAPASRFAIPILAGRRKLDAPV